MTKVNKISNLPGWVADNSNPANLDTEGGKLTGLPTPIEDSDASTKKYVDDNAGGGGGSQPLTVVRVSISFNTPDILTGALIYTPAVGETFVSSLSYVSIPTTAWNGTAPTGALGRATDLDNFGGFWGGIDMTNLNGSGVTGLATPVTTGVDQNSGLPYVVDNTDPWLFKIDNDNGGDPGSTQGEALIVLTILAAS